VKFFCQFFIPFSGIELVVIAEDHADAEVKARAQLDDRGVDHADAIFSCFEVTVRHKEGK